MAEPSLPAAAQTDAEREEALDRMLMRLALAEDARLAPLLARVLPYAITSLASPAASVRKLSAKAIKKLCDALGESLSVHHNNILKSLLKELHGRFWEGKDAILDALAALCSSCHAAMSAEDWHA